MLFKVYHIQQKPVDLCDRDLFVEEWSKRAKKFLEIKPASDDDIGWQAINDSLNDLELELKTKYKCEADWNVESLDELVKISETYGTLSLCIEPSGPVLYVMDLPAQQKIEVEQKSE